MVERDAPAGARWIPHGTGGTVLRLVFSVWLIYCAHFSSNVVRETYLAVALGEDLSIRVDEYLGLHPDLFEIEGRGGYINNNPGASMLAAVPYAAARPAFELLYRAKPDLIAPKPPTTYDDPRPNRTYFMNQARERGVDVKLGLAAASMQVGLMAPLAAVAALLMFLHLRGRLGNARTALGLAALYAFATPIFFRSAFLNQNVLIAHFVLGAYLLLARRPVAPLRPRALLGAGALLGAAILCDYSGVPLAVGFGVWILAQGWRTGGAAETLRYGGLYMAGAAGPLALLLGYQWAAFGNALLPAQTYMPPTEYSVMGWNGFFWPAPELLWRNLFDPAYGLFAYSPLLILALLVPFVKSRGDVVDGRGLALIGIACAALYLFVSSVQFAYLQWNTGVRYMVPAVPLLFFAAVPVLVRMRPWARDALIIATLTISWSVAMTREAIPVALARIFMRGFELPWLTVLERMAAGYAPFLADGTSPVGVFVLLGLVLWLVWRNDPVLRGRSGAAGGVVA